MPQVVEYDDTTSTNVPVAGRSLIPPHPEDPVIIEISGSMLDSLKSEHPDMDWEGTAFGCVLHELFEADFWARVKAGLFAAIPHALLSDPHYQEALHEIFADEQQEKLMSDGWEKIR